MQRFKNKHKGKRAFIACNGPGLNDIDVSKLKGEIVFGLNRGYLKKELPIKYLVVVNDLVEKQFGKEMLAYAKKHCSAFFTCYLTGPDCYRLQFTPDIPKFTGDPTKPMWQGYTVTYSAIQLAYYMGISSLYLIGLDHYFSYDKARKVAGRGLLATGPDPNHFSPNYWGKGVRWDKYGIAAATKAYKLARKAFDKKGYKIYNASSVTHLSEDIFPLVNFDDLF